MLLDKIRECVQPSRYRHGKATDERAFRIGFWGLALGSALPVFAFPEVPGADLPAHMAILRHLADAVEDPAAFGEAMAVRAWQPYWGFYGPTLLLAQLLPLDLAARIILYLALIALPASLAAIARREALNRLVALGAFPLLFGFNWYWGFAPFYVSSLLAVAGLIPVLRQARSGGRSSLAWVSVTSLGIFVAHATAWALWAAWSLWLLLTEPQRRRRRAGGHYPAARLPRAVLQGGSLPASCLPGDLACLGDWARSGLRGDVCPGPCLETGPQSGRPVATYSMGGLAVGMLGSYWILPQDLAQISFVYPRFLIFGFEFSLLCLARNLRFPKAFLVAAVSLKAMATILAALGAARFSERAQGARWCLSQARPGGVLMPFPVQRDDPDLRYPLYLDIGAWYAEMKRGRVFGDWIEALPTSMVHWKDPAGLNSPPPAFLWASRALEDPFIAERVDYFLIHGPRTVSIPGGDVVSLDEVLLPKVAVERPAFCESGR